MSEERYHVVVLGTGPAGLQAAIHAARKKVRVLVLGRAQKSSAFKAHIENYCCMDGVAGVDLLEGGRAQAEGHGAVFLEEDVLDVRPGDDGFRVETESGSLISTAALVLAMGVSRNKLGVDGEKALFGKGVSYCVDCDAGFYRDRPVAVAGGASAAVHGALTLLLYTPEVHLIARELEVSGALAEKIAESAVTLHLGRGIREIRGTDAVSSVALDDGTELPVKGVFVELGARGAVALAGNLGVALDPESMQYVAVDRKQATSVPGVYAAGDICGPPWQVAKAVGEGCVAGLEAAAFARKA
jgi:thioredoxin reductase (NADPH)